MYRYGGNEFVRKFLNLFVTIWKHVDIPQELKYAFVYPLFKRKGKKELCGNHRGISLPSVADKIFTRVILNRIMTTKLVNHVYPES